MCSRLRPYVLPSQLVSSRHQGGNGYGGNTNRQNIEWIIYSDGIKFKYFILRLISRAQVQFIYGHLVDLPSLPTASRQYKHACDKVGKYKSSWREPIGSVWEKRITTRLKIRPSICGNEWSILRYFHRRIASLSMYSKIVVISLSN